MGFSNEKLEREEQTGMRKCTKCGEVKPKTDEYFHRWGKGRGLRGDCKVCKRSEVKGRVAVLRERRYDIMKQRDTMCADCGIDDLRVIDFHHIDPTQKLAPVAYLATRRPHILEAEMDKCIPLCANCHRIRHWTDRDKTPGRGRLYDGHS